MNGNKAFAPRPAKIRITGLENYTRCGVALKLDLVANPDSLSWNVMPPDPQRGFL